MRAWTTLGTLCLVAACSGDSAVEPLRLTRPPGAAAPSRGPDGGFPVVNVLSAPVPDRVDAPAVGSLGEALARVRPGGRIKVHPGVYAAASVRVEKPVTIEAVGAKPPVLDAGGSPTALEIVPGAGLVAIRGLRFLGATGAAVAIHLPVGEVRIEDTSFDLGRTAPGGEHTILAIAVRGSSGSSPGAGHPRVTIRNTTFQGGDGGIDATFSGGGSVAVLGSTFREPTDFAVVASFQGSLRVENSTFASCGWLVCVGTDRLAEARIRSNRVSIGRDRPLFSPVRGHGSDVFGIAAGTALIEGNTIAGEPGAATPSGYSISRNAIQVGLQWHRTKAIVRGNRISGATGAIWLGNADVTGSDNVVRQVGVAFGGFASGPPPAGSTNRAVLSRNDVSDFQHPLDPDQGMLAFAAADLACNWWGSGDGPGIAPGAPWPPTVYSPWAVEPIANRPSVRCPR